jgi:prefoldin subunit 5
MNEEDFKSAINNILMMQNNNDANFQILQRQIDGLQKQLSELNDLKEMFRLPKAENMNRQPFEEVDE